MVGGDLGVPSNPTIVISLLPADAQLGLWNPAPALEYFRELSSVHKYERLVCCRYTTGALGNSFFLLPASSGNKTSEPLAVGRALLRLVPGSALPALQRERQLRSSAFPNQTDNLSLRWCSRKSKN